MDGDLFSLKGKVVLVTGGAGHLGAALSEGFAQYGATVYIASRNLERNKELAQALMSKFNVEVIGEYLDTNNNEVVENLIEKIVGKHQRIDVLVNNSYNGKTGDLLTGTEEDWLGSFNGSIHSAYRLTKAVLPKMIQQSSGSIINIASMYGVVSPNPEIYKESGQNNPPQYGAGKAAIIQFTKYLACHYGQNNIRANAISPGPFPHEVTQKNKEFIQELNMKNPLGRIGVPKELKGTAILLASDASSYITGQNICVDGGWTSW